MTDKDVERVAKAIVTSFEHGSPDLAMEMRMDWQTWAPEARAACAAYESAVTEIAKLGTVSLTSFDGHCVRIDFPNREDAERMYAVLTSRGE